MKRSARGRLPRIAALIVALAASPIAHADPVTIETRADLDRLAELVLAYKDATRVRWVIEAADTALRTEILDGLADRLGPVGSGLLERVTAAGAGPATGATARLEITPPPARGCSWRVTVSDPAAPSRAGETIAIPIERGDIIPTSPDATFEVGFAGPLQSTLYAFAETSPGAIRDLAASPAIAIPVSVEDGETLVLVRARRPIPFLDRVRDGLADLSGKRGDLGRNAALAERFRNAGRGIGANIQLVDPGMIVAELNEPAEPPPAPAPVAGPEDGVDVARADDLVETCLYTVTRLPGGARG